LPSLFIILTAFRISSSLFSNHQTWLGTSMVHGENAAFVGTFGKRA